MTGLNGHYLPSKQNNIQLNQLPMSQILVISILFFELLSSYKKDGASGVGLR